jgi:hypothetical protein
VVVHRDGEGLLGLVLTDDVGVEELVDLARLGQAVPLDIGRLGELLLDDLVAEIDALVADVHARSGDELLDLLLALTAERALQQVATVTDACHPGSPLHEAKLSHQALAILTVPPSGVRWTNQTPSPAREGRGESSRLRTTLPRGPVRSLA